jgi:hypothetical protein
MDCYFDISNYIEFSKQTVAKDSKETTETANECLRMIKKNFNIIINHENYESLEEEIQILLEEFQSGFDGNLEFDNKIKEKITDEHEKFFGSIILLDDDDLIQSLKDKQQILVGSLSEETKTLSRLFIDQYDLHKEKSIGRDITFDSNINLRSLPINKIFIIDRYLFKGPEIGGNISLFEHNMEKVLRKIFENRRSIIDLIFVYQINKSVAREHKDYDEGPDKEKLVSKIKKIVHISLIAVPKGKIADEHDRHIITDYLRIKSGDSFTYFKSNGEICSKSLFVDFYSHGKNDYNINTKTLMEKINDYTNEVIAKYPGENYIPKDYKQKDLIVF